MITCGFIQAFPENSPPKMKANYLYRHGLFILVLLCIVVSYPLIADTALPNGLNKLLQKYGIKQSAVSLDIREVQSQKVLLSLNQDVPRNPASVIKLVTTLSALELLGPAYQWETSYLADGVIKNGILEGNLVMQGGGDPFLTLDRFWSHIQAIKQRGIHSITGDLIIDPSLFEIPPHDRGGFDGQEKRLYNVGPGAALVNFSATRFIIQPLGNEVVIVAEPNLANLVIENNLKPQKGKCISANTGWSFETLSQSENLVVRFNGHYRPRCGQHSFGRSIAANNEYTFQLFKHLWRNSNGQLKGDYQTRSAPENAEPIVTYPSEPLANIITSINKFSNNVMARQLLLTIGAHLYGKPGTVETGIIGITSWLDASGLSMPKLVIENGAGLSRNSRITARELSQLLKHGWESNYQPEFFSSLSLSALDGTMRKRLKDSPIQGRARIKTGLINGVRSMAGYVHARDGRYYTVAMMIDSKKVNYWNGNQIQDTVLSWIYSR